MPVSTDLPSITVLLTGHNEAHCIRQAIESIFNQDYQGSVQIIMGDDGSQDATYAVMQQMAAAYRGPYDILLHHNPTPLGRGYHIRQLAGLATGDWIIRQDGDDCSFPWRLSTFAAAARTHPDAAAIMSRMTNVAEEPGEPFVFPPFPTVPVSPPLCVEQQTVFSAGPHYGGATMIRRSVYQFAESLPMAAQFEDDLYGFYAWLCGPVYELPETPLYYYRFAAGKAMGLQHCQDLIDAGTPCYRTRDQLLAELAHRRQVIAAIHTQQHWWCLPFLKRWRQRPAGLLGIAKTLPEPLYLYVMVAFFKLRELKRKLSRTRHHPV